MNIDPKAWTLLEKNEAAMLALRSYSAECWSTTNPGRKGRDGKPLPPRHEYATLIAVKPNLMRYRNWSLKNGATTRPTGTPNYDFACDGKSSARQFGKSYRVDKNVGPQYMNTILEPWGGFYTKSGSLKSFILDEPKGAGGKLHALVLLPPERVDGTLCQVVSYHFTAYYENDPFDSKGRLFFGPDSLVRRKIETVQIGDRPEMTWDFVLRKIRTNFAPPPLATFVYRPPQGVKSQEQQERERPKLLASGKKAPDFTALALDEKPVRLSDFQGKVVVLDFWATWCGPCMQAMPSTNRVAREFKERGVVVLAVNVWDDKNDCMAWIKKNEKTYESVLFAHDPAGRDEKKPNIATGLYSVSGIPTQFVIDAAGVVRASFVGFNPNEKPLRDAIEAALKG